MASNERERRRSVHIRKWRCKACQYVSSHLFPELFFPYKRYPRGKGYGAFSEKHDCSLVAKGLSFRNMWLCVRGESRTIPSRGAAFLQQHKTVAERDLVRQKKRPFKTLLFSRSLLESPLGFIDIKISRSNRSFSVRSELWGVATPYFILPLSNKLDSVYEIQSFAEVRINLMHELERLNIR